MTRLLEPVPGNPPLRNDARERQLLQRVAQADRHAFDELYLSYHRRLARFLMRLVPRYDIAEEVINDTFWVVWQKAGEFRGDSRVSTWLMGIAYRRALKTLRSAKNERQQRQILPGDVDVMVLDDPTHADAIEAWVLQALGHLPHEQRLAIELAYYLGHSCEEIADIMQCPVNTVKARMFHARQKLKTLLPNLAGEVVPPQPARRRIAKSPEL
jgi:RNA polymerase sigma-70 factor, ECF subfamily